MANSSLAWTWEQDKAFETALAMKNSEDIEDNWDKIASEIPGNKTIEEVKQHYQTLVGDIELIECGEVPLPCYPKTNNRGGCNDTIKPNIIPRKKGRKSEWESRKGEQWTQEEHRLFLLGMETYGKGFWKCISRDFVKTRTPTQVASHAQKHFGRQMNKQTKVVKRWSIFDITTSNYNQGDYSSYPSSYCIGSSSSSSNNNHYYKGDHDNTGDQKNETMSNINDETKSNEVVLQQQQQQLQQQQQQRMPVQVDSVEYIYFTP